MPQTRPLLVFIERREGQIKRPSLEALSTARTLADAGEATVTALALGARFLWYALKLKRNDGLELPMRVFRYSINYLMILFAALLVDHYLIIRFGL